MVSRKMDDVGRGSVWRCLASNHESGLCPPPMAKAVSRFASKQVCLEHSRDMSGVYHDAITIVGGPC